MRLIDIEDFYNRDKYEVLIITKGEGRTVARMLDFPEIKAYTKADMADMLKELEYELYHALCHEIHGKKEEDCPCTNQTTSCLATFRVCDANRAIGKVIQQKINALKGANNE